MVDYERVSMFAIKCLIYICNRFSSKLGNLYTGIVSHSNNSFEKLSFLFYNVLILIKYFCL